MFPPFDPRKSFLDLSQSDLARLIEDQVKEGSELDYKRQLPSDAVEFCKDASSFANKSGGYLVFGLDEENRTPTGFTPISVSEAERIVERLQGWALEGIRPRIVFRTKVIALAEGGASLVLEIPRSWVAPHEVRHEHRYYSRNEHGKYQMDVDELRIAFGLDKDLAFRAREFVTGRIAHWFGRLMPLTARRQALLLVHVLPFESLQGTNKPNLKPSEGRRAPVDPPSRFFETDVGFDGRPNLDGYKFDIRGRASLSIQLFRNGAVEIQACPEAQTLSDPPRLISSWVDRYVTQACVESARMLKELRVNPPAAVCVSLLGAAGWAISDADENLIEEDRICVPEVILDDWESGVESAADEISTVLWNCVGLIRSPLRST